MDVRVGLSRKLSAEELMFLNCGVEKALESPLDCKEIQPVHPKGNQSWIFIGRTCWSWNSNTMATWCEDLTHLKRPWCWKILKGKGIADHLTSLLRNLYAGQEATVRTGHGSALLTTPKPLTVWITINCGRFWERWEYKTTWPASWEILYAGQEATVRTGHGTTDWFQIGKGVHQGCILSPCLFN